MASDIGSSETAPEFSPKKSGSFPQRIRLRKVADGKDADTTRRALEKRAGSDGAGTIIGMAGE
jgi:hypothetical protein